MESFLGNVASSLHREYGEGISSLRILLPNMRSRLFFKDELARVISKPVWQPAYLSVDDIMEDVSGLRPADRIRAVVELYKVWTEYHDESFDKFYYWGEMLLSDFDQIDKYMADASDLFRNIGDLKNIGDDFGYFNEEQREVLARFWKVFGDEGGMSAEKERFITIWNTLLPVYNSFRDRLLSEGVAYTGMMYRVAAEKILANGGEAVIKNAKYAVVGFNALSKSEKVLFDSLQSQFDAQFFWDYDDYYADDKVQEAGLFIRENINRYPQPPYFRNDTGNFVEPKNITAVAAASDSLQCKYTAEFLRRIEARQGCVGKETAIVLTNEELLIPLLYSLPDSIGAINVTMGYPLRRTLEYSFVERLLKLQGNMRLKDGEAHFYHGDVNGLLAHPFVAQETEGKAGELSREIIGRSLTYVGRQLFAGVPLLERIFFPQTEWRGLLEYIIGIVSSVSHGGTADESGGYDKMLRMEFAGEIAGSLRSLSNSLKDCGLDISIPVIAILARRMLQGIRIPYSGEPLCGLQVMGILETRNLDFDNVLLLSMNDDNFPGNTSSSPSFIPYNLRLAYGLPAMQYHDGVYAYYFYRLLQRAGNVEMTYSSSVSVDSSGEPSRYILQLKYESPHAVTEKSIDTDVSLANVESITVEKSDVAEELAKYTGGSKYLSPSALNSYLDCPLKFYFRYIARINPEDEVLEDIDNAVFGSILHRAMELLYEPLLGIRNPTQEITELIGSVAVEAAVDRAIGEIVFDGGEVGRKELEGDVLLVRDIVRRYINNNILPFDARQSGFTILKLEWDLESVFRFAGTDGRRHTLRLKGKADRVDLLDDGRIRIVDYKTGAPHSDFASLGHLFGTEPGKRNGAALQTFVYSMMAEEMQRNGNLEGSGVQPALYYVRMMNGKDYSPLLADKSVGGVESMADYEETLRELLGEKLGMLFDLNVPFEQCPDTMPCRYCDYDEICRRR